MSEMRSFWVITLLYACCHIQILFVIIHRGTNCQKRLVAPTFTGLVNV
jgi:hypothetical protein